jgi:hypothetical protein
VQTKCFSQSGVEIFFSVQTICFSHFFRQNTAIARLNEYSAIFFTGARHGTNVGNRRYIQPLIIFDLTIVSFVRFFTASLPIAGVLLIRAAKRAQRDAQKQARRLQKQRQQQQRKPSSPASQRAMPVADDEDEDEESDDEDDDEDDESDLPSECKFYCWQHALHAPCQVSEYWHLRLLFSPHKTIYDFV